MEDLEPEPMSKNDIARSTRFQGLIRSAFVQEKIGVAKVAERMQIPVDVAQEETYNWMNPSHDLVE